VVFPYSPAGGAYPLHEAEHRRRRGKKGEIVSTRRDDHAEHVIEPPSPSRSEALSSFAGPSGGRRFFWFVFFGRAKKMNENNELNNLRRMYFHYTGNELFGKHEKITETLRKDA
jgi:hypothetical protein